MENKKYALWYVSGVEHLEYIDFIGSLEECTRLMRARAKRCWAIMPAD